MVCAHPVHLCRIKLNEDQEQLAKDFSEYLHDVWARDLLDRDWQVGEEFSKENRTHPELVPFKHLPATVGHVCVCVCVCVRACVHVLIINHL